MRLQGDRGQVGGIEVLPFGFLFFVAGTLLIANAWGVVDAKLAVTAAAREAVRTYVESPDENTADSSSRLSAARTLRAYGRDDARATIEPAHLADDFGRCVRVSITVSYEVPVLSMPFLGGLGTLEPVSSTFSEVIDPYRAGLPGRVDC